jgi:hypothetical protein
MGNPDIETKFETRLNTNTGRWEVVRRDSDGSEVILGSHLLEDEAMSEIVRLSGRRIERS